MVGGVVFVPNKTCAKEGRRDNFDTITLHREVPGWGFVVAGNVNSSG